jgi:hypothetical protein
VFSNRPLARLSRRRNPGPQSTCSRDRAMLKLHFPGRHCDPRININKIAAGWPKRYFSTRLDLDVRVWARSRGAGTSRPAKIQRTRNFHSLGACRGPTSVFPDAGIEVLARSQKDGTWPSEDEDASKAVRAGFTLLTMNPSHVVSGTAPSRASTAHCNYFELCMPGLIQS